MAMSPKFLRPRIAAAAAYDVASLPNLVSWWDASAKDSLYQNSNGTTAVTAADDPVGYWKDLYGTNHIIQATAANRPAYKPSGLNNRKAILFDGVNDALRCTPSSAIGANELTVFSVWAVNVAGTYIGTPLMLGSGPNARPFDRWQSASQNFAYVGNGNQSSSLSLRSQITPIVYRIEVAKDGVSSGVHTFDEYINSTDVATYQITSTYSTTSQVISVGARADSGTASNIYVSEMILLDGLLDAAVFDEVTEYLAKKWGVTL